MHHGLGSSLRDARVKVHEIFKFIHGVGTLWRPFPFTVRPEISELVLHVLLYTKQAPIETSSLVTYDRRLSCWFLPPSQRFLRDMSRGRWGRSQTRLTGYPTETAIQLWRVRAPVRDSSRVSFVVGGKTVPSGLRLRCPQKLIHQQATGLRTTGGIALNQSYVQLSYLLAKPIFGRHLNGYFAWCHSFGARKWIVIRSSVSTVQVRDIGPAHILPDTLHSFSICLLFGGYKFRFGSQIRVVRQFSFLCVEVDGWSIRHVTYRLRVVTRKTVLPVFVNRRAGVGDSSWHRSVGVLLAVRPSCRFMSGMRVGNRKSRRTVPSGGRPVGGLMLWSRGTLVRVNTSVPGRRSWWWSVGDKLAGRLMLCHRGTFASALWRDGWNFLLVWCELAGRLMQ